MPRSAFFYTRRVITPRQLALRTAGALLLIFAAVYAGDFLWLAIRSIHPTATNPYESMKRTRVLAIPQKNGKTDYQIDEEKPTETLTCVHSLFPHRGYPPCWKLKPHINDPIPMTIAPPGIMAGQKLRGWLDRGRIFPEP